MEKFTIGLAIGALMGAAIVANSQKTRKLFIKSQEDIKNKLDGIIDEKMEEFKNKEEEDEDYEDEEPVRRTFKKRRT